MKYILIISYIIMIGDAYYDTLKLEVNAPAQLQMYQVPNYETLAR